MALPFEELEAITNDYFMVMDGKMASDIYFDTSFLCNYFLKQQKGLWKRPPSGRRIRIPLMYDGGVAEFYGRGGTTSSDKREKINAAYFEWKHCYGSGTILNIDELANDGPEGMVDLVKTELYGAQMALTKLISNSIYDLPGGSSLRLTGLRALCNETTTTAYGGIQEDDMVAADGTKPWEGKMISTAQQVTLPILRNMRSQAKTMDGPKGKPTLCVTTETLYNSISNILQVQQRFTEGKKTAEAGFTGLHFEGLDITADDYCPDSHLFQLNENHIGFAVHKNGYFMRTKWKVIEDSPEDKTIKFYCHLNLVCNNRKAHIGHSALSA